MKDTVRAKKPTFVSIDLGSEECRVEKLLLKETGQEQIRLSVWSQGKMQQRPISLSEQDLTALLRAAIREGVLSQGFASDLQSVIEI
jgi:hypothetical protein